MGTGVGMGKGIGVTLVPILKNEYLKECVASLECVHVSIE